MPSAPTSRHRSLHPAAVALIGLLATAAVADHAYRQEASANRHAFQRRCDSYLHELNRNLNEARHVARQMDQLFMTFSPIERGQFDMLAHTLQVDHPFLLGLRYERLVPAAQRRAFESSRRTVFPNGALAVLAGGRMVPAPPQGDYRVVDFALPPADIGLATPVGGAGLGSDNAADPQTLSIDAMQAQSLRLQIPHYGPAPGVPVRLLGFNAMTVDPNRLFGLSSRTAPGSESIEIALQERAPATSWRALYRVAPSPAEVSAWPCLIDCEPMHSTHHLDWAGRRWQVQMREILVNPLARHGGSLTLLIAGMLATLGATLYQRSQQSGTRRIQQLVHLRTAELRELNAILQTDIDARKKIADELTQSRAELRQLAEHNARVKEDERKRIAREIHDDLGQNLLALRIDLTTMSAGGKVQPTRERIQQALVQIDTTMGAMRAIINELRPAVLDLGLDAAIEWESSKFHRRTGIICELDLHLEQTELDDGMSTALYRVVQESFTNIMRHARATHVRVCLWADNGWIFLTIADNGIGMDVDCRRKSKSFGLIGIAERIYALGGAFDTESASGRGTKLIIALPALAQEMLAS